MIRYRSPEPVLTPESPQERIGTVANVVFPTAIDRRDDLGLPDRFDVYYGMADNRIGVARLDVPEISAARSTRRPVPSQGLTSQRRSISNRESSRKSRSRSQEVHRHHDAVSHHRSAQGHHRFARTGRTVCQHPAFPGRGRRAEGQVRAPGSCLWVRRPWPTRSGIARSSSTRVIPSGPTGTASCSRPDMDVHFCMLCSMSRASTCPWRNSRGSASGEAEPRAIRNTARPPAWRPPPAPWGRAWPTPLAWPSPRWPSPRASIDRATRSWTITRTSWLAMATWRKGSRPRPDRRPVTCGWASSSSSMPTTTSRSKAARSWPLPKTAWPVSPLSAGTSSASNRATTSTRSPTR